MQTIEANPATETENQNTRNMPGRPTFVIYHDNCADGFAAATVAYLCFGDAATYLPAQYGKPFPGIPDGARVFILDFSWPYNPEAREKLNELAERTILTVIDHHKTAAESLKGRWFAHFEEHKSGAVMAWEYFRDYDPDSVFGEVPELLLYVQDRDLWRWELPSSKAVSAGLAARPKVLAEWAQMLREGYVEILNLKNEGAAILRYQKLLVEQIVANRRVVHLGRWKFTAVNTQTLMSECCDRLLEMGEEAGEPHEFVAAYFYEPSTQVDGGVARKWSLRSRPGFDCSVVAKEFGGGGHAQACGFTEELGA